MSTWSTRRERYGETGHPSVRVSRIRFRQKPLRTRGKVAIVARETAVAEVAGAEQGFSPSEAKRSDKSITSPTTPTHQGPRGDLLR